MDAREHLGALELPVLPALILPALIRLGEDAYGVPVSREIEEIAGREVTQPCR